MRISDWSSDVCSSDLPVARGAIASIQDGFVVGRWISVEKALHRIVANILAAFGKCPGRIVALHAASGDFAFGHAPKHGLVHLPGYQTSLAAHQMVRRKIIGTKAAALQARGLCLCHALRN